MPVACERTDGLDIVMQKSNCAKPRICANDHVLDPGAAHATGQFQKRLRDPAAFASTHSQIDNAIGIPQTVGGRCLARPAAARCLLSCDAEGADGLERDRSGRPSSRQPSARSRSERTSDQGRRTIPNFSKTISAGRFLSPVNSWYACRHRPTFGRAGNHQRL